MKRILALAVLASLAAAPAMAADNDRGFYWGFDLGQFQYNLDKRALDNAAIAGIEGKPEVVREPPRRGIWELLDARVAGLFPAALDAGTQARLLYLWQ